MASSSNAPTPNKNNTLMRLLRDLELSRKEAFEQLRKDKEQSDLRIQEHIQRLEAKEQEREARKRGHSRRKPSQEKQTPKIPKFKGENDPNIYIEWEQKVDQIFTIHVVSHQKQVDLVVLEFEDYAMTWWHQLCMDNINQESLATSWRDLKNLMRARFVPSYYRRETLLKLQMLQQGSMCVDEYYKLMESMLLKVGLQFQSEEEKVARFVSELRRDIQYLVELYEYSSLDKVLHLTTKVATQLQKKKEAKRSSSYNDYCSSTGKIKKENMINHHPRVPKTHLLRLIRLGLLMKLLILLKVQGQVL